MLSLLKLIDGPWEKVRAALRIDLETIQSTLNQRWAATFGDNNILSPSAGGLGSSSHTAHALLVGEGANPIASLAAATNGQIPIGKTGADPVISTITAGTGQTITNGAGSIIISPTPHALLDGVIDNDTTTAAPVLGDLMVGNATPKWDRLAGQITSTQKFLAQVGDGVNSAIPSWQTIPAAGSLVFFFYNTASDIGGVYKVMKTPASTGGNQTIVTGMLANGDTTIASFATLAGVPNITFMPAGVCTCYVSASANHPNVAQLLALFYQRTSGGVETLIATSSVTIPLTGVEAAYIFQGAIPSSLVFLATDRVVCKIVARVSGMSPIVTLDFEDTTAARAEMPSATVDATNFVPYTGATANVDLGSKNLTTTGALTLPTVPLAETSGGTGKAVYAVGDLLTADTTTTLARLADVAVNSILISKGVGVIPAWNDNVNLGTAGSGFFNISGRLAVTKTLLDDGIFAQSISATFPSVITANRTAVNYDIISAGSSAFNQMGVNFTLEPGYTGTAQTFALTVKNGVITASNQAVGIQAVCLAAGLSNCAISGVSKNGTNGNIGVYGGIGGFTEGNFNFNITAAILASNGATTNDIYRGYSSTTLKFSVTDAGNIVALGSISAGAATVIRWTGVASMSSPADGQINLTKNATTTGVGLDVTTDAVLAIRTRAQNADAAITHAAYTHSGAEIDKTYTIVVPVTGDTKTMAAGQSRIIFNPAGTLALLTVTLPSSPVDGQVTGMSFTQIITGLTVNAPGGATVVAPPTTAAVDSNFRFLYQASSTSWFPCS